MNRQAVVCRRLVRLAHQRRGRALNPVRPVRAIDDFNVHGSIRRYGF